MSTIDQLMEGKQPGEIKVCRQDQTGWFQPFVKAKGEWWGRTHENQSFWDVGYSNWTIYTEPKPTKVVYEWIVKVNGGIWQIEPNLLSEDDADNYFAGSQYRKTGRSFEIECE